MVNTLKNKKMLLSTQHSAFIKEFMHLAITLWVTYILGNVTYIADNIMVSNLCGEAVTAIGIIFNINGIPYKAVTGLLLGSRAFTLKAMGQKDINNLSRAISVRFLLVFIISFIYLIISFCPLSQIIINTYTKSTSSTMNIFLVKEYALSYWRIIAIQFCVGSLSRAILSTLKEFNKGNHMLLVSSISVILNIVLNWLLIYGNLGFPALGIVGAGVATLVSSCVEIILYCLLLYKSGFTLHKIKENRVLFKFDYIITVLKYCIPIVCSYVCSRFVFVYIQQCYSVYSIDHLTAINISTTIIEFLFIIGNAMNESANILINKSSDENCKKFHRLNVIRRFVLNTYICLVPFIIGLGIFILHYGYTLTDTIIRYSEVFIIIYSITYVLELCSNLEYLTLLTLQKSKESIIINSISYLILDLPVAFLLTKIFTCNIFLVFLIIKLLSTLRYIYGRAQVNYYYKTNI